MKINGRLLTCDFTEDTLTIRLPKGFWSVGHVIMAGNVYIDTDGILPPRNKKCSKCLSGLVHEEIEE